MKDLLSELPPLLTPQALAAATGIPVGTWAAWRSLGTSPSYVKANRRVLYPRANVITWLERGAVHTTEGGGNEPIEHHHE